MAHLTGRGFGRWGGEGAGVWFFVFLILVFGRFFVCLFSIKLQASQRDGQNLLHTAMQEMKT